MNIDIKKKDISDIDVDLLLVGMWKDEHHNSFTQKLPDQIQKEIKQAIHSKAFKGEFNQKISISTLGKIPAKKVLVLGLGEKEKFTSEQLRRLAGNTVRVAKGLHAQSIASVVHIQNELPKTVQVQAFAEGCFLGNYQYIDYVTQGKEDRTEISSVHLLQEDSEDSSLKKAKVICEAVNYTRQLVNGPPHEVTPEYLAKEAKKLKDVKVTIFDKKKIKELGMGGLTAVGQGSAHEPYFIILDYGPVDQKPLAIVGKGVTFDAGGINTKPAKFMEDMKSDMSGAAAVLGVFKALPKLGLKKRVVGIVPTAENMPGGSSFRIDDIITFYNGKTAEVNHTDAEGRLILADGLSYVEKHYHPKRMIDIATLTGACVVALGYWATALLSTDEDFAHEVMKAGEESGDRVWRLPFWDDYKEGIKSKIADVRNSGKGFDAGTIEAGHFLSHFVDKTPWVHLDIAGTAFFGDAKHYHAAGGTGAGVRLLLKYIENSK